MSRFAKFKYYGWTLNKHIYWHIAGGALYPIFHAFMGWTAWDAVGVVAVVAVLWEGLEYAWHTLDGTLADAGYGDEDEEMTPFQHFFADAIVDFFGALGAAIVVFELIGVLL